MEMNTPIAYTGDYGNESLFGLSPTVMGPIASMDSKSIFGSSEKTSSIFDSSDNTNKVTADISMSKGSADIFAQTEQAVDKRTQEATDYFGNSAEKMVNAIGEKATQTAVAGLGLAYTSWSMNRFNGEEEGQEQSAATTANFQEDFSPSTYYSPAFLDQAKDIGNALNAQMAIDLHWTAQAGRGQNVPDGTLVASQFNERAQPRETGAGMAV